MTPLSGITTISFDVDRTLWDFEGLSHHALGHALNELAKIDPEAAGKLDVERLVAIRNEVRSLDQLPLMLRAGDTAGALP